jgi:hypothetical protein
MVFQEATSEPAEKGNRQHDIWCLITNIWANRVAIVSSVITKIFTPCKYWTVTTPPSFTSSVNQGLFCSLPVLLFMCCLTFSRLFSFCSICFVWLFGVRLFVYSVYFSVLILELYSSYFDPHNNPEPDKNKSSDGTYDTAI